MARSAIGAACSMLMAADPAKTTKSGSGTKSVAGTKAIDRALQLLSSFVTTPEQGITDIAAHADLSPSTVHRIVQALVQSGYLEQNAKTDRYHLGHAAHLLGQSARERWGYDRALPILERIGSLTGESVNMGVADGNEVVVVLRVESVQPLRLDMPSGSRIPMHCSSMGKSLLAFSSKPLPKMTYQRSTPTTITSEADFQKELTRTAKRGYAIDNEESIPGVSCVAAPILDSEGTPVAAIAIQGPTVRMTSERLAAISEHVIAAAAEIRDVLGLDKLSNVGK